MKFCPDCKFMLYTSIYSYDKDTDESKQEGGDEKKTTNKLNLDIPGQLLYYCKNCGWEEVEKTDEMNTNNQCIYKRNYQEDYIADRVICNKYTIYDNTLPRVTYECINNDCPTNLDIENLTDENNTYIMIDNLPPDATDEEIDMAFIDDADKIFKTTRVKLTKYIVQFNTVADKQLFQQKMDAKKAAAMLKVHWAPLNQLESFLQGKVNNKIELSAYLAPNAESLGKLRWGGGTTPTVGIVLDGHITMGGRAD
jgi:hypothetical protein